MGSVFTVLMNSGTIITDIESAIGLFATVEPELVDAEKTVVASFTIPAQKLKADIEAMPTLYETSTDKVKAITDDVITFFADAGALAAATGQVVILAESKLGDVWSQITTVVTKLKSDFQNIAGTPVVVAPTTAQAQAATVLPAPSAVPATQAPSQTETTAPSPAVTPAATPAADEGPFN